MPANDHLPSDLQELYEVHDYRHAAAILAHEFPDLFQEVQDTLRRFRFTVQDVLSGGGNRSRIPKLFSSIITDEYGWKEETLTARLLVDQKEVRQDTHKIDYVKGRVAFDLEWNSKDQTFDRDLYAFRSFFDFDRISAAVLVTRSNELDPWFRSLGIMKKYGASTTHMGKLLPRLQAGRSGGCPILVFGITTRLLEE